MDDVIEVYLKRLMEIYQAWQGSKNIIRFDDRYYINDLKKAIVDCGLAWNQECYTNTFNREKTTEIVKTLSHPVQNIYDQWLQLALATQKL